MKNSLDGFELDLKRQQKESVNLAIGQRMLLNIGNGKEKSWIIKRMICLEVLLEDYRSMKPGKV